MEINLFNSSSQLSESFTKRIDDSIHKPLYDNMHEKLQTPYAKRIARIRSSTGEPVLGTLLNFVQVVSEGWYYSGRVVK